jgi:phosphoribosylamine-glycine ligase
MRTPGSSMRGPSPTATRWSRGVAGSPCVCALGETVGEAQRRAYERLSRVHFEGMYYRRDIGARALARERARR